jgi:hypothetical protein
MSKKTLLISSLVVVILGAWMWLYRSLSHRGIELDPYQELGEAAGRETAKLLQNRGRLVLVDAAFAEYKILAPINEAQIRHFKKAVRKTGLKIVAIEKVPISPPTMSRTGIFMQPGKISDIIARHSDVDAIVLFVGLANARDLVMDGAKKRTPKLVLVSNYEAYYKELLEQRLIHLAIVPRPEEDAEQFVEKSFVILTPEHPIQSPD